MLKPGVLAAAVKWAQDLPDDMFKWHLMLMAETDAPILDEYKRKALIHEVIQRMGL